jgi:plastocyanin
VDVNTRRATLALAAAAALTLAACGSDAKTADTTPAASTTITPTSMSTSMSTTTSPSAGTTMATSTGTAATGDAVSIGDFAFEPANLSVAVGTTVTWTNDHDQPHTATSAGNFDTGAIQPGESKTVTFDQAGTFSYICSFHPFMTGTVTVA